LPEAPEAPKEKGREVEGVEEPKIFVEGVPNGFGVDAGGCVDAFPKKKDDDFSAVGTGADDPNGLELTEDG